MSDNNEINLFGIHIRRRQSCELSSGVRIYMYRKAPESFDLFRISNASTVPESRLSVSNATRMMYVELAKLFAAGNNKDFLYSLKFLTHLSRKIMSL